MTRGAELTRSIVIAIVAIVLAPAAPHADAALTNGSFETDNFSGWSATGNTSTSADAFGIAPTHGTYHALMTTGSGSVSASSIEAFLGLSPGRLGELSTGKALEGSAIKQSITANAADVLVFDWNFLTDEPTPSASNDFSFWSLVNLNNGEVLADTNYPTFQSTSNSYTKQTGYQTTTFVIPTSGTYTLGFGVMDAKDSFTDSGLLVDNVRLTSSEPVGAVVPEPSSVAIWMLLGAGSLGTVWRRRRASASCPQ